MTIQDTQGGFLPGAISMHHALKGITPFLTDSVVIWIFMAVWHHPALTHFCYFLHLNPVSCILCAKWTICMLPLPSFPKLALFCIDRCNKAPKDGVSVGSNFVYLVPGTRETPAWKPNLNVNTSVLNMESKAHWEGEKPIFMKLTFVKDNMKYVSANYNPTF